MVFHWSLSDNKSPGLFSVFCPILTVLSFGWSSLVFLFPILPVSLPVLWWLYQADQLQLVSPSLSCSIVFFSFLARSRHFYFFPSFNFTLWSAWMAKSTIRQVLCFLLTIAWSGLLAEIRWSVFSIIIIIIIIITIIIIIIIIQALPMC